MIIVLVYMSGIYLGGGGGGGGNHGISPTPPENWHYIYICGSHR